MEFFSGQFVFQCGWLVVGFLTNKLLKKSCAFFKVHKEIDAISKGNESLTAINASFCCCRYIFLSHCLFNHWNSKSLTDVFQK